jgi:glycosyltransferase involved in cell wall biosynthesis
MAMGTPLVSVVIPTYNQPDMLAAALDSVLAQTFDDYEVVVVNDGSTDDTGARLAAMREKAGEKMRVVDQVNSGVGAARNRGLGEARGRYVAFLDHDDVWKPGKLAEQVRYLQRNEKCIACGTLYALSTQPDRPHFQFQDVADEAGIVSRPFWHTLKGRDVFLTSTLMIDANRAAGIRYGTQRGAIEDVQYQIKLLTRGVYGLAGPEIMATYRLHPANASKASTFYFDGVKLLRRMLAAGELDGLPRNLDIEMRQWLAHLGRIAAIGQLTGGRRLKGAGLYLSELPWQLRDGRARFVMVYPLMLLTPARCLQWAYEVKSRNGP